MKNLIIILLIVSVGFAFAQDDRLDELKFDSDNYDNTMKNAFALGAGYSASWYFADLSDLNTFVENNNFSNVNLNATFFMNGFEAFSSISYVPGLRLGISSAVGNSLQEDQITIDGSEYVKEAEFRLSFTTINFDYMIRPISSIPVALVPGIGLGWINTDIKMNQSLNETNWSEIGQAMATNQYHHEIKNQGGVLPNMVGATLKIEWALLDFAIVRGVVGYNLDFSNGWEYNGNENLNRVPAGINGNGLRAEVGLFLGLFNY